MMAGTLGRDNCASRYIYFTCKDHKSIKTRKRKLDKKIECWGEKGAALKIMCLFSKLTINKVPVN